MIGIDIVDIEKFESKKKIYAIFTERELTYAKHRPNSNNTLAGIFAAKEAVIKAYGLKLSYILRKKIEIILCDSIPMVLINSKKMDADISISHDGKYAMAVCYLKDDNIFVVDDEIKKLMPKRESNSHKGTYGRIAVLGGSSGMAGSVYMASLAAMRTGAGLTYIIAPKSISQALQIKSNEQIIKEISCGNFHFSKEILDEVLKNVYDMDVLAIGPGMGKSLDLHKLIGEIITNTNLDIVIDADGLNAVSDNLEVLESDNNIVLTPHLGEFSRLSNLSIDEIKLDIENIAKEFARDYKVILVLKSHQTIVTDGNNIYVNKIGNPGMATAGSGDVLTGIISSLMKRIDSYDAAKLGVYIHSLAGDIASKRIGVNSMIATDIIDCIPEALKLLE